LARTALLTADPVDRAACKFGDEALATREERVTRGHPGYDNESKKTAGIAEPGMVRIIDDMPLTMTLKVKKRELRSRLMQEAAFRGPSDRPLRKEE